MNKLLYICIALALLSSCSYNELPPKTDDATGVYVLPKGVLPTAEEKAAQNAARSEYNDFINK